eukprot:CAMPEP_0198150398 /NCGR_PEP_ID=MMETSP1443-20131203/50766_1 /TAXON_ID=186043 /ORGANISM="Entomoneis sp., Strain CCMP2396" /LENGTH=196 /DNA_ID=CAMNT_0043815685 /DNA_START=23 /DNA_END=613 /DNA_ORIENTATION=-
MDTSVAKENAITKVNSPCVPSKYSSFCKEGRVHKNGGGSTPPRHDVACSTRSTTRSNTKPLLTQHVLSSTKKNKMNFNNKKKHKRARVSMEGKSGPVLKRARLGATPSPAIPRQAFKLRLGLASDAFDFSGATGTPEKKMVAAGDSTVSVFRSVMPRMSDGSNISDEVFDSQQPYDNLLAEMDALLAAEDDNNRAD